MPQTASFTFDFIVDAPPPPLSVTSGTPPPGLVGSPYTFTFTAAGGIAPYTWSLSVPIPGLTLDPATGILSGTPTTAGTTAGDVVTVTDSSP